MDIDESSFTHEKTRDKRLFTFWLKPIGAHRLCLFQLKTITFSALKYFCLFSQVNDKYKSCVFSRVFAVWCEKGEISKKTYKPKNNITKTRLFAV